MAWCTTADRNQFTAAAGGYLRSRAAENTLLLSAVQAAPAAGHPGGELLLGWWEPPGGGPPRGAFVDQPGVPLLIAGRAPETAAALAATLARLARPVYGVDAPTAAADAFAAAWSQRAGAVVRVHRQFRVHRLTAGPAPGPSGPGGPRPAGRLRVAGPGDAPLLTGWLAAFAAETHQRIPAPAELAAELIGYHGALLWEIPYRPGRDRLRDAARHQAVPHRRGAAPGLPYSPAEPAAQPAALIGLARPVAGTVRISLVYTPPERRRRGFALGATLAVSRAVLADGAPSGDPGPELTRTPVDEVVLITDGSRPVRSLAMLGFQVAGERTVVRFGPVTGPLPRLRATGASPRLPAGPTRRPAPPA